MLNFELQNYIIFSNNSAEYLPFETKILPFAHKMIQFVHEIVYCSAFKKIACCIFLFMLIPLQVVLSFILHYNDAVCGE